VQQIVLRSETHSNGHLDLPVVLHPGEDGQIVAVVPPLPGCISQGRTEEEALVNVTEAAELCLESIDEEGWSLPPNYSIGHIEVTGSDA
jgi:predicted RNase H-like HicB family nuclease